MAALLLANAPAAQPPQPADYAADAVALDGIIAANYAYLDRFGDTLPVSPTLDAERAAVHDADGLLRYAERRIASLADHHAITGRSFKTSWGLVPSYADLWIVQRDGAYVIDAVRAGSPAAEAGVVAGDRLVVIGGVPVDQAVSDFWGDLGFPSVTDAERRAFAARVLAAGRRNVPRQMTLSHQGREQQLSLPNLYQSGPADRPPVTVTKGPDGATTIRFNDSLGRTETIAAFDAAMAALPRGAKLVLDLGDTGSGGDSLVARAVMGWFVDRPRFYQMHRLVAEEREHGVVRQWVEQVLPRPGKHHAGPVSVRVGRWTGSMGEGLAIGFMAIGVPVCGGPMAGLRGAIYDFTLPATNLLVKLPAEKLFTVAGQPRESVVPPRCAP